MIQTKNIKLWKKNRFLLSVEFQFLISKIVKLVSIKFFVKSSANFYVKICLAIIHCTTRNDLVLILSSGNVVDCVARMAAKNVKINLLEQIPFQFEKKTLTLTRDSSPTQQLHFQKNVNAIVAFE